MSNAPKAPSEGSDVPAPSKAKPLPDEDSQLAEAGEGLPGYTDSK